MADGVPVLGYHHWTLMDNFEWIFGYEAQLGLHSVDRETFARTAKPSAAVYAALVEGAAAWMSCRPSVSSTTGRRSASARPRRGCRGRSRRQPGWRQAAYELAIGDEVFRVASA